MTPASQVRDAAAKIARDKYKRGSAHTYASENGCCYSAQEDAAEDIAKAIEAMPLPADPPRFPASQTRTAAAKIARDFSASVQCSAFPHSRQTADEIARMIEAMAVPDEPFAIGGLAEDMAKALEPFAQAWNDALAQFPNGGTMAVIGIVAGNSVSAVHYRKARAVLDRFNAAKKEQAT